MRFLCFHCRRRLFSLLFCFVITLAVGLHGFPAEIPFDHEEHADPGKLSRMRLMRLLWNEYVLEASALADYEVNNAWTSAARAKIGALSQAINAMAAPTGKDSDGNPTGDDGINMYDVEFLISTTCPFHFGPPEMKRDVWFELCEPRGEDGHI